MAMNIDAAVNITADVNGQSAVDKLSEALKKVGNQGEASSKQVAAAMRMVPAQLTDIATQLAGGQSPFLIMLQQGGQLRDAFGSISGALVGVGRTMAGMINPVVAVGAAFAGIGYAAYKGAEQSSELNRQLLLTGGAAGYTAGQIEKMAESLRDTAGIAAGTARDLTTGLAASGQFVGKSLDDAASAAAKLQKLTGQSSDEIVKDFAKMSGSVAAWAAEHNKQFNYLSLAQFQHIKQLEDMGNKEAAIKENIEALNKALEGRKQNLGTLEQAWQSLGKAASWAWDRMLNIGREELPEQQIDKLKKEIADLEQFIKRGGRKGLFGEMIGGTEEAQDELNAKRAELAKPQGVVDAAQKEAADKAKEAAKIRQKIEEEQNGKANALQNAQIQLQLTKLQGASDARVALLEDEGQRIENRYRAGLITEETYNAEKLRIAKDIFNERAKLIEQEQALEKKRPVNSQADAVQQQSKIQALRNQARQLEAQATQAELKAEGDRAAYLRQMDDAVQKFGRTQDARIAQIKNEADSVGMSTLEYRKHTEALRIDKEAADAAVGKSPDYVAAIMAEAEAKKQATDAALEYAAAKSQSFDSGVKAAMKDYVENTANAANQAKTLFGNAFKGMEDSMVEFVKTGKLDFGKLADSIISDLIRITIQAQIMKPLMSMLTGGGSDIGSMFGFANGGVMTSAGALPLNTYANGGVANKPQLALFGEGRTPEAFVPLPDGRHIPVAMQGGGGGSNVVVNVVNNTSGAKASAQERQGSGGQRIIDVVIEQVKASIAADISRGVGTVTSALERTYGANRAAGAY